MNIDQHRLEINVNLHALQPGFLNRELHYVIAADENNFRFAELGERPDDGENRFYCFLSDREMIIPAGNIIIKKSYVLAADPIYPLISTATDFIPYIDCISDNCTGKAIRNFDDTAVDEIYATLQHRYGRIEKHLVKSPEFQHILFVLPQVEISIAATMVYFKQRTAITSAHYEHLKEDQMA